MPKYAHEIADLFHNSIHETALSHYSKEAIEAWAPTPPDYLMWADRLMKKRPFLAMKGSIVVGFIELESDGHIDCLYTHKDFQRCGVARCLYLHLETEARKQGINRLYVEASFLAKPFFEKHNYNLVKENIVHRNGTEIINFKMEKCLAP